MNNLFIDFCNKKWIIILFNENKQYVFNIYDSKNNLIDIGVNFIFDFLSNHKTSIDSIKNLYVNLGPGNYTGVKCTMNFAKTIKLIYKQINIYTTNSFALMLNNNLLKIIDTTNSNAYWYDPLSTQIKFDAIDKITNYAHQNNLMILNYTDLNVDLYVFNIINNLNIFKLDNDFTNTEPIYIKHFL